MKKRLDTSKEYSYMNKEQAKKYRKVTRRLIVGSPKGYMEITMGKRYTKQVPKTKRLRKKKMWYFCVECKQWFHRFKGNTAKLEGGGRLCKTCLRPRLEAILEKMKAEKEG